jgi:KipI family sensor histidine kinase inhibitor
MHIIRASDASLLVVFGEVISPELHHRVLALYSALQADADPRVRNLHPAYASLLIDFDPLRLSHEELADHVEKLSAAGATPNQTATRAIEIPVCYGGEFGPDLGDVAGHTDLPPEEVIRLHSSAAYLVYFLGFSPGFAYLGGLPEKLRTPRLQIPRKLVTAGTVGIAGSQTGVYPVDSPGGWRLIGRTPLRMFDPGARPPTRLQPGDQVRFVPIDRPAFDRIQKAGE